MARETKVALVAGLSFIILFAVILTNRGRRNPILANGAAADLSPPSVGAPPDLSTIINGQRADRSKAIDGATAPAAGQDNTPPSARDARDSSATLTGAASHAAAQGSTPVDAMNRPPASTFTLDPQSTPQSAGLAPGNVAEPALSSHAALGPAGNPTESPPPASAVVGLSAEARRRELQAILDRTGMTSGRPPLLGELGGSPLRGEPQAADEAVGRTKATSAAHDKHPVEYVVEKGDTLYRIAARFYGSGSRDLVGAIHDANRATLPTPDHLVVGQRIVLPDVSKPASSGGEASRKTSATKSPPPAGKAAPVSARIPAPTPKTSRGKTDAPFRWYQVRKDDRYVSIAREQLGDAGRWRELYELNKDKFPQPDKIREGVRIKLPVVALASAGE